MHSGDISTYNTQLSACRGYALPKQTLKLDPEEEGKTLKLKKKEREREKKKKKKGERELHNNNTPRLRARLA